MWWFLVAVCILIFLKSPKVKGWLGEICVKIVLGKTKPGMKYVINNLLLNVGENKTSQIDHVLINANGIFVIETKNYSGRIYGCADDFEWTQVLRYGKVKNKFYNPIKQNKTHVYHISKIINQDIPLTSAVVFVRGNTRFVNAIGVYNLFGLKRLISSNTKTDLTPEQMLEAYELIIGAKDTSTSQAEHINNIRSLRNDIDNNICPRCGKRLIIRNGKNGSFYGCEGYPQCRFTKRI